MKPAKKKSRRKVTKADIEAVRAARAACFDGPKGRDYRKRRQDAEREARVLDEHFRLTANTPSQRIFAWCPWCDTEMVSAKARWWQSVAEMVTYFQCPHCKRRSRWRFHENAVNQCLDDPRVPRKLRGR